MNFKEIQDLIKLVSKSDLSEFKLKQGEMELSIRTKNYAKAPTTISAPIHQIAAAPAPVAATPAASSSNESSEGGSSDKAEAAEATNYLEVKSPIVGTFYRSPSPDKDAFVKVGDTIAKGDVVCIIEAMKLFNEIESEISGKIVKVLLEDASPVEYDQVLYLVDPKG